MQEQDTDSAVTDIEAARRQYADWSTARPPTSREEAMSRGRVLRSLDRLLEAIAGVEDGVGASLHALEGAVDARLGGPAPEASEEKILQAIQAILWTLYACGYAAPDTQEDDVPAPGTAGGPVLVREGGALMTIKETAAYLGRSPAFTRSLMSEGLVPYRVIRGRFYIARRDLDAWLGEEPKPARVPVVLHPF